MHISIGFSKNQTARSKDSGKGCQPAGQEALQKCVSMIKFIPFYINKEGASVSVG